MLDCALLDAGDCLHVRCVLQHAVDELALDFRFKPRDWYHVAVAHHAGSALTHPTVRLFVEGRLEGTGRLKYPKVSLHLVASYSYVSAPSQPLALKLS